MSHARLELEMCTREEYTSLAKYCGTVPESRVIVMRDGVQIGSRSNNYFYISRIAFEVAFGRKPSGKSSKNRSQNDRVL